MGFTLDPVDNAFILSRTNIICPSSGPYYSLNEARYNDWSIPLQNYIQDAKCGLQHQHNRKNRSLHSNSSCSATTRRSRPLSSRYVCSLCADFHRTLLVGGWCGNPRTHLRLLYEAAPLAFVIKAAGGYGCDGSRSSRARTRTRSNSSNSNSDNSNISDSDSDGTNRTSTSTTTTTSDCNNLLDIVPVGLHDRVCVFLGSTDDIDDLLSYGDVRQVVSKTYEA